MKNRINKWLALLLAGAMLLALVACGSSQNGSDGLSENDTAVSDEQTGEEQSGGEESGGGHVELLRIGTTQTQEVFSGWQTVGAFGKMLYNSFVFANLFEWDEHNEVQPGFIQSWEFSEDGLTLTITFPTDVTWHDGEAVTAEDVEFTFQMLNENKNLGITAMDFPDDHTGVLTFESPVGLKLLNSLTITAVLIPKHIWEGKDLETYVGEDAVIGCGPYKFVSYDQDAQTSYYEAVENYFKGEVTVDRVSIRTYTGQEALVMALAADEIDAIYDYSNPVDPTLVETLTSNSAVDVGMSNNTGDYQLSFGCNAAPMNDLAFRKAVINAIDYEMTASVINGEYGEIPSLGIIPPSNLGFDDTLPRLKQDVDAANAALDEGGYLDVDGDGMREMPDGSEMDIMICMQYGVRTEMFARLYEVISEDLAAVGIKTTLDEESVRNRDVWMAHQQNADFEIYLGICTTGVAPFSTAYHYLLASSRLAAGTYAGEEINAAYQQALTAKTTEEYVAAIKQVQQCNTEEYAGTALCWDKAFFPYRTDKITGWVNYPAWGAINNQTWYTLRAA